MQTAAEGKIWTLCNQARGANLAATSKTNDGMPNESLNSMLQKAKVKITSSENSESGIDEVEIRIKNSGKNNLKVDIMNQLQNALNRRKNRNSLKDKYNELH